MSTINLKRVDVAGLSDAVLVVLAEEYQNSEDEYVQLDRVRQRVRDIPANYLRDALKGLTEKQLAARRLEKRRRAGTLNILGQQEINEDFFVDAWRITSRGLAAAVEMVEKAGEFKSAFLIPMHALTATSAPTEDLWTPIKIDRTTEAYSAMISNVEDAIDVIEKHNGYSASSVPEERSGLLSSMRGTLKAVTTGWPSKEIIVAGLLKPLRHFAEKFSGSAIGEAAKKAVEALLNCLF